MKDKKIMVGRIAVNVETRAEKTSRSELIIRIVENPSLNN
jgi:hypothetical protein